MFLYCVRDGVLQGVKKRFPPQFVNCTAMPCIIWADKICHVKRNTDGGCGRVVPKKVVDDALALSHPLDEKRNFMSSSVSRDMAA